MFALLRLLLLFQMMLHNRNPSSWASVLNLSQEKDSFSVGRFVAKGYFDGGTPDHFDWLMRITNSLSSFVIDVTASYNFLE